MRPNRVFISWQPVLTDHQAFTYQALAGEAGVPVVAFVTTIEDRARKEQGWTDTQVCSVERRLIPQIGFFRYAYRHLRIYQKDIHFFASPFQHPKLMLCMLLALCLGIEFYLISEPYSPNIDGYFIDEPKLVGKFKAAIRPWVYRVYALIFRAHISGIFAISRLALLQYQKSGLPLSKLFPFGYFIPADIKKYYLGNSIPRTDNSSLRIIFVGNLIKRKGVDLLQEAIKLLSDSGCNVTLDIYGPGDFSAISSGHKAIHYCGKIPFGQAQNVIARYDLLVLPSRHDGWGVVVNEALCAGVPVVCSNTVGAGEVASAFGAGLCFTSGDARSLSNVLARLLKEPTLLEIMRVAAPLAADALQPDVAARYMLNVIQAPAALKATIRPPWYIF
jgi:glycosyltransferase involved in cell wall biosynthesis